MAATPRDQLVQGVTLLFRLQAGELSNHTLQPDGEGLAEINHLLFYCSHYSNLSIYWGLHIRSYSENIDHPLI